MWRPFTGNFVGHSYGSYVKKNGRGVEKPRVKAATLRSSDLKYLFPNNAPPQVVEERMKRFYDLRVKVDDQRVVIKTRDAKQRRWRLEQRKEEREFKLMKLQKKKEYFQSLRYPTDRPRTRSYTPDAVQARIFALTTMGESLSRRPSHNASEH